MEKSRLRDFVYTLPKSCNSKSGLGRLALIFYQCESRKGMEKGVPPHPFPCLFCGVTGSPGNQEPEVPPPRVPIICEDEINFFEDLTKIPSNRVLISERTP